MVSQQKIYALFIYVLKKNIFLQKKINSGKYIELFIIAMRLNQWFLFARLPVILSLFLLKEKNYDGIHSCRGMPRQLLDMIKVKNFPIRFLTFFLHGIFSYLLLVHKTRQTFIHPCVLFLKSSRHLKKTKQNFVINKTGLILRQCIGLTQYLPFVTWWRMGYLLYWKYHTPPWSL